MEEGNGAAAPAANGELEQRSFQQETVPQAQPPQQNYVFSDDWKNTIPEELRPIVEKYNSPEHLARAYREAAVAIGKKAESFTDRDWQLFMQANERMNNVPTNPDGYDFESVQLPENNQNLISEDDANELRQFSHYIGLNKEQAQHLYSFLNGLANSSQNVAQESQSAYIAENNKILERDWGKSYKQKMKAVDACLTKIMPQVTGMDPESLKQEITRVGAHHSATFLKMMAAIGEMALENTRAGYNALSPFDARSRLEHMKMDPNIKAVLGNRYHKDYPRLSQEFQTLSRIANKE
jgi:hypothetical protein